MGSKAWFAGPDFRFAGTALSARSSMKSLTMKSLFEKFSRVKLGPWGKIDLALAPPVELREAIGMSRQPPRAPYYIELCDDSECTILKARELDTILCCHA